MQRCWRAGRTRLPDGFARIEGRYSADCRPGRRARGRIYPAPTEQPPQEFTAREITKQPTMLEAEVKGARTRSTRGPVGNHLENTVN